MSQEDVAVVERMIEAFRRGDSDAAFACIAQDVRWDPSVPDMMVVDESGDLGGHESVRRFFRRWLGTWTDYSYEQLELVDAGDGKVVSVFVERGTGKGSGLRVEKTLAGVYEVRDGLVSSWKRYPGRDEAYRAAGLTGR